MRNDLTKAIILEFSIHIIVIYPIIYYNLVLKQFLSNFYYHHNLYKTKFKLFLKKYSLKNIFIKKKFN